MFVAQNLAHAHGVASRACVGIAEALLHRRLQGAGVSRARVRLAHNAPNGITRQAQQSADLAQARAGLLQAQYAGANFHRGHNIS